MTSSGTHGWNSGATWYKTAPSIGGTWTAWANVPTTPTSTDSYNTQHDYVLKIVGTSGFALAIVGVGGGVAWWHASGPPALPPASVDAAPAMTARRAVAVVPAASPPEPPVVVQSESRAGPWIDASALVALIERDPRAAVNWLETQPDAGLRAAFLGRALNNGAARIRSRRERGCRRCPRTRTARL